MKSNRTDTWAIITVAIVLFIVTSPATAQITIKFPKIPKIEKTKSGTPESENDTKSQPASGKSTGGDAARSNASATRQSGECDTEKHSIRSIIDDIGKNIKQVEEYTPTRNFLTYKEGRDDFALLAISKPDRDAYYKKNGKELIRDCPGNSLDEAFDRLAGGIGKILPAFLPVATNFTFHNVAEEKLLRIEVGSPPEFTIYKIGFVQANWLIDKNELGIPKSRYKQGNAWVRKASDGHPYCHLYSINIIQDYAGGGTYGASYAYFGKNILMGCPADK